MIRVVILGSGNVSYHLADVLSKQESVKLVQVFSRNAEKTTHIPKSVNITDRLDTLAIADVYILAISDDAVASVSSQLPFKNRFVVHTSGGISINEIDNKNRAGVLYPLQSFSKARTIDFKSVPFCIEAQNESDYSTLENISRSISNNVYKIDSEQRKALHLSAVFVNNFANHLFHIGYEICQTHNVSFDLLKPLIQETAQKILHLSPKDSQTGPAIRGDIKTIQTHEKLLSNEIHKEIYSLLTKSIQHYAQKL